MEHLPEPEEPERQIENPVCYECPNCKEQVFSTYANTLYVVYPEDKQHDHLRIMCEKDGYMGIAWVEGPFAAKFAEQFMKYDQELVCQEEGIIEMYAERQAIRKAAAEQAMADYKTYELSARQEKLINFLGYCLLNTPDEQILAEMAEPMPDRTLPSRWT